MGILIRWGVGTYRRRYSCAGRCCERRLEFVRIIDCGNVVLMGRISSIVVLVIGRTLSLLSIVILTLSIILIV